MLTTRRYTSAARMSAEAGDREEALRLARRGLEISQDCLGSDHELYRQDKEFLERL